LGFACVVIVLAWFIFSVFVFVVVFPCRVVLLYVCCGSLLVFSFLLLVVWVWVFVVCCCCLLVGCGWGGLWCGGGCCGCCGGGGGCCCVGGCCVWEVLCGRCCVGSVACVYVCVVGWGKVNSRWLQKTTCLSFHLNSSFHHSSPLVPVQRL